MTTLEQIKGDEATWIVTATNADGSPVTGATARLTVRESLDLSAAPVIDVTADIVDGVAAIMVPAEATAGLANRTRRLSFDVQVETTGGDGPWTIDSGLYVIRPEMAVAP